MSEEQKQELYKKDINLSKNMHKVEEYKKTMPHISFGMMKKDEANDDQLDALALPRDSVREAQAVITHMQERSNELQDQIRTLSQQNTQDAKAMVHMRTGDSQKPQRTHGHNSRKGQSRIQSETTSQSRMLTSKKDKKKKEHKHSRHGHSRSRHSR